jgi:hypothetical protein
MPQAFSVLFPVLAIKALFDHLQPGRQFEAAKIDTVAIRIGAWHVKRFDAAMRAEEVSRRATVKAVFNQIIPALEEIETGGWNNEMHVTSHAADRAIAMLHGDVSWQ